MTPLAAMAGYIFVRATSELIDENFPTDAPWLMAALMLNSCLTLVSSHKIIQVVYPSHYESMRNGDLSIDGNPTSYIFSFLPEVTLK